MQVIKKIKDAIATDQFTPDLIMSKLSTSNSVAICSMCGIKLCACFSMCCRNVCACFSMW